MRTGSQQPGRLQQCRRGRACWKGAARCSPPGVDARPSTQAGAVPPAQPHLRDFHRGVQQAQDVRGDALLLPSQHQHCVVGKGKVLPGGPGDGQGRDKGRHAASGELPAAQDKSLLDSGEARKRHAGKRRRAPERERYVCVCVCVGAYRGGMAWHPCWRGAATEAAPAAPSSQSGDPQQPPLPPPCTCSCTDSAVCSRPTSVQPAAACACSQTASAVSAQGEQGGVGVGWGAHPMQAVRRAPHPCAPGAGAQLARRRCGRRACAGGLAGWPSSLACQHQMGVHLVPGCSRHQAAERGTPNHPGPGRHSGRLLPGTSDRGIQRCAVTAMLVNSCWRVTDRSPSTRQEALQHTGGGPGAMTQQSQKAQQKAQLHGLREGPRTARSTQLWQPAASRRPCCLT